MRRTWIVVASVLALAVTAAYVFRKSTPVAPRTEMQVSQALSGDAGEGYARVTEVRPFVFPRDHGAHPEFRNEWWYFTGNVATDPGRRFGYELTLFRVGLKPGNPARASRWAAHHVYMGHLALTDVAGQRFRFDERFARAAAGLAGAMDKPFAVWLEDWSVRADAGDPSLWKLSAATPDMQLAFDLRAAKPIVLQGDRGLSQKSSAPGNASYYYSIPRLDTRGEITVNGESFPVTGVSWLDREWSTSALGRDQAGWDWFGVQLSNGQEFSFYRLRHKDGTADPHSAGIWVYPDGKTRLLRAGDVVMDVLSAWASPRGGTYPARVRLHIKPLDATFEIEPMLADQELAVSVRYWEGAVNVRGHQGREPVTGQGYMELTGYAQ